MKWFYSLSFPLKMGLFLGTATFAAITCIGLGAGVSIVLFLGGNWVLGVLAAALFSALFVGGITCFVKFGDEHDLI